MFDFDLEFARNGAYLTADLFRALAAGGLKENIVFSPFSVQLCVSLAFAGASGETAEEILNGLKLISNVKSEVAASFQYVLEKYKNSDLLKIANKVYVDHNSQLKQDYESALKEHYFAEAEPINFAENTAAADAINEWVKAKTEGKISELVAADCLNESTRLVLLNALHFKGSWAVKFDEEQTAENDFWIGEEETVKVEYMSKKAKFGYGWFEELGCTALEMAYKDSDLSMFVLLPNERMGLKALSSKLKEVNMVDLAERMNTEEVIVQMPKFKVDYSIELNEPLQKLGIKKMFNGDAEFGDMLESSENIFVSKVLHKACIEVNEEGTEAAAATGMIMMMRCAPVTPEFRADHPFLYMIWNKRVILFAGAFVNAPASS